MSKAFGHTVSHVVLLGKDGEEHANGKIKLEILADAELVSRNGRIYVMNLEKTGRGITVYSEVRTPYIITEF